MKSASNVSEPYRGLAPYRYADRAIFFERAHDTTKLLQLVTIFRGSLCYGESGVGKSSLMNAGLIPRATTAGMIPTRLRVQCLEDAEFIVEPISTSDGQWLPRPASLGDASERTVIPAREFHSRVQAASGAAMPLLIFDQFEELVTAAAEAHALDSALTAQANIVATLVALMRDVGKRMRLLFVFREDYLARLDLLFYHCPELTDQYVRLVPPPVDALFQIIRGPFLASPGTWNNEIDEQLANALTKQLVAAGPRHRLNLSQVQIACLQLWRSAQPETVLERHGVSGLVNDFLDQALIALPSQRRKIAEAILSSLVTREGTRKVVPESELLEQVEQEAGVGGEAIKAPLGTLVDETKMVRRDRQRETVTYEIVSEFLVPWVRGVKAASILRHTKRRLVWRGLALLTAALVAGGAFYYWRYSELSRDELVRAANRRVDAANARADRAEQLLTKDTSEKIRQLGSDVTDLRTQVSTLEKERDQQAAALKEAANNQTAGATKQKDMERELVVARQRISELEGITEKLRTESETARTAQKRAEAASTAEFTDQIRQLEALVQQREDTIAQIRKSATATSQELRGLIIPSVTLNQNSARVLSDSPFNGEVAVAVENVDNDGTPTAVYNPKLISVPTRVTQKLFESQLKGQCLAELVLDPKKKKPTRLSFVFKGTQFELTVTRLSSILGPNRIIFDVNALGTAKQSPPAGAYCR